MKTLAAVAIILFLLTAGILFSRQFITKDLFSTLMPPAAKKTITFTFNKRTYQLTVARTEQEKQTGLSRKDSLADNSGMVFPFEKDGYWAFWMKNMRFPIDIVYLQDKKVITIYRNVQHPTLPTKNPPIYKPQQPADMVVELKAGETERMGLKVGDTLTIAL